MGTEPSSRPVFSQQRNLAPLFTEVMTPIKASRAISPLHHSTPTLTSTATTKNATVDNITAPASLVRILHPVVSAYAASVMLPTLFAAERSLTYNRSAAMFAPLLLLGEGLAQLVLLLFGQVGGDDLEVILLELVYHPVGGGGPAGEREQRRGNWRHFLTYLPDEIVVYP